jgi:hypothetical protein
LNTIGVLGILFSASDTSPSLLGFLGILIADASMLPSVFMRTTVEEKVAAAETAATEVMPGVRLPAPEAERSAPEMRPVLQVAKRRTLPAGSVVAQPPHLAQLPAAPAVSGDRSHESLHTPRVSLLPAPLMPFRWGPARLGADAALAGPNGITEACNLQSGEYIITTCSVHVQRAITQNKHKAR